MFCGSAHPSEDKTSSSSQQQQQRDCVCVCVCVRGFVCKYTQKSVTGWVLQPTPFLGVSSMICMFIYIELLALNHLSYSKFSQLWGFQTLYILVLPIYLLLTSISVLSKDLSTQGRNDTALFSDYFFKALS